MATEHNARNWDGQARAVEHGKIDGYHVVYEQAPNNWSAYPTDVPGVIATGRTRAEVERVMREAIAFYFEEDGPAE
jgi:predicted RNase H-like HicB family nuclease